MIEQRILLKVILLVNCAVPHISAIEAIEEDDDCGNLSA
jgi:hypothetical protein